jgi:alanyl-tRNA synthetase
MEGDKIYGEIDWNHRFSNMQQHSGEHIFSGLVYKNYGYANVGFHLSDQIVTMDFDGPLTKSQVEELEWQVNQVIASNVEIKATYPTKEALEQMEYRSKKEIDGAIRIVEIKGYDLCACCAPHVARTGEIGGFKIQTVQNYKGGVRISFLCGFRALEEARKKAQIITELSSILTTSQEQLAENVQKLKDKNQELQFQLNRAKQVLVEYKLKQIPKEQKDVLIFEEDLDTVVMRNVVNQLMEEHPGICGVFVRGSNTTDTGKNPKQEYTFIIGSKNIDCREIAVLLREKLGARGGGSKVMIQGNLKYSQEEVYDIIVS